MGRVLYLLIGAAAILTAISLIGGTGTSATRTADNVSQHGERVLAREVALSGHGASMTAIRENVIAEGSYTGPSQYGGAYQGGSYTSTVELSGDTLFVVTRAQRERTSYVIRASYRQTGPGETTPIPPPFMASAIFCDNTLDIARPLTINSMLPGMNVNLHSNGHMRFLSGSYGSHVDGFGTHRQHLVTNGGQTVEQIFQPPSNPDGLPLTQQTGNIAMPRFVATDHEHLATGTLPGTISGTVNLGTKTNPAILYVNGNLTTSGPVDFKGYGIIIVSGNTDIYHDIAGNAENETRMALYGGGHVRFRAGGLNISGHLLADGNLNFEGEAIINGGLTAGNQVNFDAPVTINFRPASCVVTDPLYPGECVEEGPAGGDGGTQLVLIDFREGG